MSSTIGLCADSVDVTFRYHVTGHTGISVAGEFNGWNNTAWPMTNAGGDLWIRTARIALGRYLYKFYYTGAAAWPNDSLNHHVNNDGYQNSIIYVKNPTIYHFLPNQRNPLVSTNTPLISAYLYPKAGTALDTSTLALSIDGSVYTGIGSYYNTGSQQFAFVTPPLPNGSHTVILTAGSNADTVTFTTQGGFVRFFNQFPFTTRKTSWVLNGMVQDTNVASVRIVRNALDTFTVSVSHGNFFYAAPLVDGANNFIAIADSAGSATASSPVAFYRKVDHAPSASISFSGGGGGSITLDASLSSDPDSGQSSTLSFLWSADSSNPQAIPGINGSTLNTISVSAPAIPGEYFYTLIVTDTDENKDTTRNYFAIEPPGSVIFPGIASNPSWAQKGRIYFLFPKAFSQTGTLNAAAQKLEYIKDLGFNVIWLMPVMKNPSPIDNDIGIGYNIVDFYTVAPEYGTNQDLKNFINQAHSLGIKVILDITPNHSSRFHPWSIDAHTFKTNSPYWNWYQHQYIAHNDNGLGQSADPDNFWYYDGWDQLLNFNWTDDDLRAQMIDVFKYWIRDFGVDGYRFDVYWGPHRRYGEQYMGQPVRDALKHIKPDILLLAEDDGIGPGSETIYADYSGGGTNGGVDAAYDFRLYFDNISNFGFSATDVTNLHNNIGNSGYYPGENALYMRFMESQDADRIVYLYSNNFSIDANTTFKRTMPMASVIFTAPGVPMLWNGQEVGWGYGITGGTGARARSVINWDYQGKGLLTPHYQKLANIRGEFPAFTRHKRDANHDGQVNAADTSDFVRAGSSNGMAYAFTRPYENQNGLTVANFSSSDLTVTLNLLVSGYALRFTGGVQAGYLYYLNNLYNNTRSQVLGSQLDSVVVAIPAYGTAIYTVSLTPDSLFSNIPTPVTSAINMISGWNMTSLPLAASDNRKTSLFPTSVSQAFSYDGIYRSQDTIRPGFGYWLKFNSQQAVQVTGLPITSDTIHVSSGWNLIGSITQGIPAASITSVPPGIVTGSFFGYSGSYVTSDTIFPGGGYWVKVNQSGSLILSLSPSRAASGLIRIVPTAELPPAPPSEVARDKEVPAQYSLEEAFPNPFNPATTIKYQLAADSRITLKIYNLLGQAVAALVDETQPAGYKSMKWNAAAFTSGIYFCRLEAVDISDPVKRFTQVRKIMLIK